MLLHFDKRDKSKNQEHDSNIIPPGEILAIVIAALTLLVATIPLFRCSRFHHWVSFSISPFVRKVFGVTLPDPLSTAVSAIGNSSAIPAPKVPVPGPVFIYNNYPNAHFVPTCSHTFLYGQSGITGEEGRLLEVEESLAPRRPERVATYPFL